MGLMARGRLTATDHVVEWAFTDRYVGSSRPPFEEDNLALHVEDTREHVLANRARLAESMDVDPDLVAAMTQVHGSEVMEANPGESPEADGIFTRSDGLLLLTQVADCVPILLAGDSGDIAAVHAGWRGVVARIAECAIDTLVERGSTRAGIRAWVGPAICPRCYEVSEEVRAQVAAVAPAAYADTRAGTPAVDVRAGVLEQLSRAGISAEVVGGCTFEDPGLYSYRRDGRTGRQAGVIVRRTR